MTRDPLPEPSRDAARPTRHGQRATILAIVVVLAILRLTATYGVFSQTIDEPTHVAAGFEWLTTDSYLLDPEHPPLARIAFALGARLDGTSIGARWREDLGRVQRGNELLYRNAAYRRNLFLARLGNLPFFLLGLFAVWAWTRRLFGDDAALIAAALYAALPPILAHGGLATTDMAAAATVVTALYAFDVWLETPASPFVPFFLAFAIGCGLLAKFSFLVYFPAGALALLIARRGRIRWRQIPAIVLIAALLVWSGYKFSFGTLNPTRLAILPPESLGYQAAKFASYPGYEWIRPDLVIRYYDYAHDAARRGVNGVDIVDWAKAAGYPSPQAGRAGNTLANAPPLPRVPLIDRVLEPFRRVWQVVVMRVPHPDYLPYFNELARHPEEIAVDSNLDWGQDLLRLVEIVRRERIESLYISYFGTAEWHRHAIPAEELPRDRHVRGWIAISEMQLKFRESRDDFLWLEEHKPVRRVGKSIRLYRIE